MAKARPLFRTRRTLRRMGPLTREAQVIQNELVKLARRLNRFQLKLQEAELHWQLFEAEKARLAKVELANWHESGIAVKNGRVLRGEAGCNA